MLFCWLLVLWVSVNNQLLTQVSYISQLNECLSRAGSELTGLEVGPKLNYTRIPGITFWASTFTEKIPREKNSRFCMMMNNIPNCNGVLCWPKRVRRFLVTTTFSRKYILTKIFACTPILREKWKSVHVWRFLENAAIRLSKIPRRDRNKYQLELCALV